MKKKKIGIKKSLYCTIKTFDSTTKFYHYWNESEYEGNEKVQKKIILIWEKKSLYYTRETFVLATNFYHYWNESWIRKENWKVQKKIILSWKRKKENIYLLHERTFQRVMHKRSHADTQQTFQELNSVITVFQMHLIATYRFCKIILNHVHDVLWAFLLVV